MNDQQLVLNRIKTPDGTILTSWDRHDYKAHRDKNGEIYMVDGGLDYLKRNINEKKPHEELSVYADEPFEKVRQNLHFYFDEELKYIPICELTNEQLKVIESLISKVENNYLSQLYFKEIEYRKVNKWKTL